MRDAKKWAMEFLNAHVLNTRTSGEFESFIKNVQNDAQTAYIEALTLAWPFIEEELGQMITPSYANAIKVIAECLGKIVVIEPHESGMFYVRGVQS